MESSKPITIDDIELAVAMMAGLLRYSKTSLPSFTRSSFDVLHQVKNTGGADLNELIVEDRIPAACSLHHGCFDEGGIKGRTASNGPVEADNPCPWFCPRDKGSDQALSRCLRGKSDQRRAVSNEAGFIRTSRERNDRTD